MYVINITTVYGGRLAAKREEAEKGREEMGEKAGKGREGRKRGKWNGEKSEKHPCPPPNKLLVTSLCYCIMLYCVVAVCQRECY